MARSKRLYTLKELSRATGISMPTLQRYKERYQSRIPSVGEGTAERYPSEAIEEIMKIRQENVEDDPSHAE
jgi:predicted site-specific integrase-resolvase